MSNHFNKHLYDLREYYTPNQKFACFVLYLKITNTFFFWKISDASPRKLSEELKKFVRKFDLRCIFHSSQESVDNFEIAHKTYSF